MSDYLDMLASFGVSSAHPGGMSLSKAVLAKAGIDPEQPILMQAAEPARPPLIWVSFCFLSLPLMPTRS